MATLAGSTIAGTYAYLLKMDGTSGITGSLVAVQDGDATDSSLKISTSKVEVIPASDSTAIFDVSQADGTAVLSVDTTNARVGIGISAPDGPLHIVTSGNTFGTNFALRLESGGGPHINFELTGTGATEWNVGMKNNDSDFYISDGTTDIIAFDSNSRISLGNNDSGGDTSNTIFGYLAGDQIASGGTDNTLIGNQVGNQTSYGITTGDHNTGVGSDSLGGSAGSHITGSYNTAIGSSSMLEAEGAVANNTCVGYESGGNITTGDKNTFVGTTAGDGFDTESSNIGIGYSAFGGAVNGADKCIAIGNDSLSGAATQDGTIAIGHDALAALTSGAGNVAVGYQALASNLTDTNRNIAIGYQAGKLHSGDDNTIIGYQAFDAADSGEDNNVVIGSGAGGAINDTSSDFNVIIGTAAGSGGAAAMISCVVIGESAMNSTVGNAQTGTIAIGKDALTALTSGAGNIAIGYQAGLQHETGNRNTVIGYQAMYDTAENSAPASNDNIFIGYRCGGGEWESSASEGNVAIGNYAMDGGTDGDGMNGCNSNTVIGYNAGTNLTQGDSNVLLGNTAGEAIVTGSENICVGFAANVASADNTNNIVIGDHLTASDKDNAVFIGNNTNHIHLDFNADNTWDYTSDIRQKTDIKEDSLGLLFINDLRPVTYKHKSPSEFPKEWTAYNPNDKKPMGGDKTIHGLIAQEVKEALDKQNIDTFAGWSVGDDGRQRISAEKMVFPLIKAVQELSQQIEDLKAKIN